MAARRFFVQEEILKGNIEKLGLKIDLLSKELAPDLIDKARKLASIENNILSTLKLINVVRPLQNTPNRIF